MKYLTNLKDLSIREMLAITLVFIAPIVVAYSILI